MISSSARRRLRCRKNLKVAGQLWPNRLQTMQVEGLKELTARFSLSVSAGDLQFLDGRWYVTHSGLLRIAQRRRCCGIKAVLQERLSDRAANRWIFKATVYKSPGSKGFIGYGDADPSNVSPLVRGAEMRIAETLAVNHGLRKAYGIPQLQAIYRRLFFAFLLAFSLAHRASTAFRASSRLSSGVSFATLAFPPFKPPRRPKATAWGFLFLAMPIDSAKELLKKQGKQPRPTAESDLSSLP